MYFLLMCTLLLFQNTGASDKDKLYFSFITALTGDSTSNGGIPIIDYAIEEINNNSNILPNYSLHYTKILDSKCSSISALESFLYHFDNESLAEPTYISTVCCGCSSATIPVAEISHHWNIPHISFASSSTALNDRTRFKSFFRTLPCYIYTPHTIASLMENFKWKRLAVISQDSSTFKRVSSGLINIFKEKDWDLKLSEFDSGSANYQETFAKIGKMYRIILINTFELHAYHLLCEAFKTFRSDILSHRIVLILHARFSHEWWETAHQNLNSTCKREEILEALNYSLALTPDSYDILDNTSTTTLSGMNSEAFREILTDQMSRPEYQNYTQLDFSGSPYDAIWTLAVGLDMIDKWIQSGVPNNYCTDPKLAGDFVNLTDFDYRNKKMGCLLEKAIGSVNFTGITGRITFREEGARPENVMRIRQHRVVIDADYTITRPTIAKVVNKDTYVAGNAIFVEAGEFLFMEHESPVSLWPNLDGSNLPYDGSPQNIIDRIPIFEITGIFYFLGTVGFIFVVIAFVFNLVFKNKKAVKLGSPNLNFLIILGAALQYLSIFFIGTSTDSFNNIALETVMCNFRIWFFAIGYTLCFAVILAKQWRIYYIFSNPTASKKIIKDWMLLIVVGTLVAVAIIVLTIGTAIPQTQLIAKPQLHEQLRTTEDGFNQAVYVLACKTKMSDIWIAILYAYIGVLQLAAVFMAFTTRKVNIKALNDSKETAIMIYLNNIIITALIVSEFALNSHLNTCIALFGSAIFVAATLFLAVVFIPRAIFLVTDPEVQIDVKLTNTGSVVSDETATISTLRAKNTELENQITLLKSNCNSIAGETAPTT